MSAPLHISISAEKVFTIAGLQISNSMLTSLVVSALLIGFAVWVRASLKKTNRPTGVQNVAEFIVEALTGLIQSVTNNKTKTELFFPIIATFFLFILCNNWFGLLPGVGSIGFFEHEEAIEAHAAPEVTETKEVTQVKEASKEAKSTEEAIFVPYLRAGTADLNMTIALGLMSIVIVQIMGVAHQKIGYFGKFINFSGPIQFFVGFLEIISEFSRIISFAFRLFGNVFAGEVLLAVIGSLVPIIAPMPFYGLEIFVGFIQALVFAMLSVVFFNMATQGHGDEH
jgi:F-type H+-transporting ATPase subunit a